MINIDDPRVSFDPEDYQKIFSHPTFTTHATPAQGAAGGIAAHWMPLIACFSKARLEEIAQLRREDFMRESGADYFAIHNAKGSTKNKASNRAVPVHPVLTRLGLLDYVASLPSPDAPLFPLLKLSKLGKLSGSWGAWFAKFLRHEIGITDTRKTFHSFRHGFATNWRIRRLDEPVRFVIDGHALGSVGAKYGHTPIETRAYWMDKLVIKGFPL